MTASPEQKKAALEAIEASLHRSSALREGGYLRGHPRELFAWGT